MDRITPEQRSRLMSRIRGRDTLPEIVVRKALHAKGWRFRVCDRRFVGRPDVVIPKAKTIIDVRGCFWHRHGCKDSTMPKSNVAFWTEKWSKNIRRDIVNEESWVREGWSRIIVWECALAPKVRDRTLGRIAAKLAEWAGEVAAGKVRRTPHRLEIPAKRPSVAE